MARVTSLHLYPVKSLRAVETESSLLEVPGLAADRRWMLIDDKGRFVTQRQHPALAKIEAALDAGVEGEELVLRSPECPEACRISSVESDRPVKRAVIWGDECRVIDEGDEVGAWLGRAAGLRDALRLVRMAPDSQRPQSRPQAFGQDTHTHFADAAPILVTNSASLERLNERLAKTAKLPVSMDRFRPNVVIDELDAFAEQRVSELVEREGRYSLKLCYPCERCAVITVEQQTGVMDRKTREPFRTLVDLNPMPGNPKAPAFGMNAIVHSGIGETIAVGDSLRAVFASS